MENDLTLSQQRNQIVDDDDPFGIFSAYSSIDVVPKVQPADIEFWEKLVNQPIGNTTLPKFFIPVDSIFNWQKSVEHSIGIVHVEAYKQGAYIGLRTVPSKTSFSKAVYFLPWKNNEITYVERKIVETSGCDFFFTSKLSGCRFVLGDDVLAHVANESGYGRTTDGRNIAEVAVLNNFSKIRRRLSMSGFSIDPPPLPLTTPSPSVGTNTLRISGGLPPQITTPLPTLRYNGADVQAMVWGVCEDGWWTYKWMAFTSPGKKVGEDTVCDGYWLKFN